MDSKLFACDGECTRKSPPLLISRVGRLGVVQKQCVARTSAEILSREDFLAVIPDLRPEMQTLVQKECLLVLICVQGISSFVFAFFLSQELSFTLFMSSLDDKLVLKILACASGAGSSVFVDEFGSPFRRQRADNVELYFRSWASLHNYDDLFPAREVAQRFQATVEQALGRLSIFGQPLCH